MKQRLRRLHWRVKETRSRLFPRMRLETRTLEDILVIKVTGEMTRRGGVDALGPAVDDGFKSDRKKILLELAPFNWDSYGFLVLALTLNRIAETQGKAVCKLGPIPIRDVRWGTIVGTHADCFDVMSEAIQHLQEDC